MTWHLVHLTKAQAMAHDRRVYKVADNATLGWDPYTYRVTKGAISMWACHTPDELKQWLDRNRLETVEWSPWDQGMRWTLLREKQR